MFQPHAEEMLLEFMHLGEVCVHVRIFGLVCLVGEVDDELGVSFDDNVLDAESDGSLEAADESFILGDVVGDLAVGAKGELHCVEKLVAYGGGQDDTSAGASTTACPVKMHRPCARGRLSWQRR